MKKIASIAIALMMVLSVSAMPLQGTATQEDDIVSGVAYYMNGYNSGSYTYGENDFNIVFNDKDGNPAAYVEITSLSSTTLQGTYHLGDGYTMFSSVIYDGSTTYPMTHGDLIMVCKNVQTTTVEGYGEVTFYTYEVQALNWHNYNTGINVMEFHGTVVLHVENFQTKAVMTLTDTPVNATEISLNTVGFQTSKSGDLWEYMGYDESEQNGLDLVCFSDSVLTSAQGDGFYLSQGVYDVYNLATNSEIYINNTNVLSTMTDYMGYVVETTPGTNEKLVVSFYIQNGGQWYHMTGVYDSTASGIEEVEAAEVDGTAKTMENGQLVIIRNGVRYNAQGAVIKK